MKGGDPMARRDAFSTCHPWVSFLFFALTIFFSMCFMDPASLAASFLCALAYVLRLNGQEALRLQLRALLPILLFTAAVNPLFNHQGDTVLARLPWGSPLTLESVLYGLAAALMLCAVINWFVCFTAVVSSDKFVYLFGRVIPALSLALSMTLRFVPRFKAQFRTVVNAQRCLGRDLSSGPLHRRLKTAVSVFSILVTWSLESAIETADSMKSRGYGLPGRTAFSIYRFDHRNKLVLFWLALCGGALVAGWLGGGFAWQYFPALQVSSSLPMAAALRLLYLCLCLTPLILNGKEDLAWKRSRCAA
jgi:energy-coupling factor transport system permease protein